MFLYKVKYKPNGEIDRFKVRLVLLGNVQRNTGAYTYSPVLNETSLRILLAYGIKHKMICHQLDICTAYLHAEIDEEIYVQMLNDEPEGFRGKIFKLKKSLYGLRNSALSGYIKFCSIVLGMGFTKASSDSCIFIYKNGSDFALLGLYVDDIILLTNTASLMDKLKCRINNSVTASDKVKIGYFLNLEIDYDLANQRLAFNQADYINQCVNQFNMTDAISKKTPVSPGTDVYSTDGKLLDDRSLYLSIVGRLIYLSTHSRPDISFIVSRLCQFMQAPTQVHLDLAKRVIRYFKHTINYKIWYTPANNNSIQTYCDADYANDTV
jgi:hypothetical protein